MRPEPTVFPDDNAQVPMQEGLWSHEGVPEATVRTHPHLQALRPLPHSYLCASTLRPQAHETGRKVDLVMRRVKIRERAKATRAP